MARTVPLVFLLLSTAVCWAQETTIEDAKKDLSAAKETLEKVVVFRAEHEGGGAFLKSEYKTLKHRQNLERRAQNKGVSKDDADQFDIANRLEKYGEQIEPEAFEMLVAYVGFVKVYRKHEPLIKENESVAQKAGKIIEQLDVLIDRHGRTLRVASLRLLYEDEPVGKVGAFNLPGPRQKVQIDGKELELLRLRTLKEHAVLIKSAGAKPRKGFILAEIVGKDTYKADDGQEIAAILLQAY